MRIVQLKAENVKRLKAVNITPNGSVVRIAGRNGAGKSSVLDAIWYALGGKSSQCEQPVRVGEEAAKVTLDLGGLLVKRTWSPSGGTYLTIESAEGLKHSSPQKVLDELVGDLTFDPLAFTRLPGDAQIDTLKKVAGLDFTAIDEERADKFEERTTVNRDLKTAQAQIKDLPEIVAPDEEVSIAGLTAKHAEASAHIRANNEARQAVEAIRQRVANGEAHVGQLEAAGRVAIKQADDRIARLEADLKRAREERAALADQNAAAVAKCKAALKKLCGELAEAEAKAAKLIDPDLSAISDALQQADETNQSVRAKKARAVKIAAVRELRNKSEQLTADIEALDRRKEAALSSAAMPVPGLGFSETGVTLGGLPFNQASSAEQLRVSVAMGIALNPKLRVMLIHEGSLLDESSLAMVSQMAEEHDMQIWMEVVGDGGPGAVVIEDGSVVSQKEEGD